jgi:hypothetical protein
MVMKIQAGIFGVVTKYSYMVEYQHFGISYYLHPEAGNGNVL